MTAGGTRSYSPSADRVIALKARSGDPDTASVIAPRFAGMGGTDSLPRSTFMLARLHRTPRGKDEGFTLIELLVVMIIIGILAAIAVPVFLSQRQKAADTSTKSDVTSIGKEIATYYVDNNNTLTGTYTAGTGGAASTVALMDGTTTVSTVKLSPNTKQNGTNAVIGYVTGGTCTNATGWYVELTNDGGAKKTWFYSAQGGLATAKPTACA
jgi:prepilin-type N-terminal cleavage/methylation domain-containing protein